MNFIFFMPDKLRAESVGCYGHPPRDGAVECSAPTTTARTTGEYETTKGE